MTMDKAVRLRALMATAEAFYRRRDAVQYDQLSMDRQVQVTPRRNKYSTPEEGNRQHTLFLDCSGFVNACYYAAFGKTLASDLTWHMQNLVKPVVYDYTVTHQETEEEKERIKNEMLSLLRPGDLLDMWYYHAGHIILIGEDGMYYHCTSHGEGDPSYHYDRRQGEIRPGGGMYYEPIAERFDPNYSRYLLGDKVERFTVMRPLDVMGSPTANAMARLEQAQGLICSVLSSHSGGKTARPGEDVTYTVEVRNDAAEDRTLTVSVTPGQDTVLTSPMPAVTVVKAGETASLPFSVRYVGDLAPYAQAPTVAVNGLAVWAERFLLQWGNDSMEEVPGDVAATLRSLFDTYDTPMGDVLWRRDQQPWQDGCLYSYFGGTRVITPEINQHRLVRTCLITLDDLQPGDLILCSDDPLFQKTYACRVTMEGLKGVFEFGAEPAELSGEDAAAFIDSLQGRICFVVQRPCVKNI